MVKNTQDGTTLLGVRVTPDVKAKLEAEAKQRHVTVNELIAETLNGHAESGNPGHSEHSSSEHHHEAETEQKMTAIRDVVKQGVKEALAEIEAEKADNKAAEDEERKKNSWPF
jgi:hydrogenase maturation factor